MKSNLNKHLENKQERLSSLEQTLRDIQAQLTSLNQELRVEQQLAKAQETIAKEFIGIKSNLTKLVKDACSCYAPEALDDMLLDLGEIVTEIKTEYASYQQSDRFLNSSTSEVEDASEETAPGLTEIPLLAAPLPDPGDDQIILNANHIIQFAELLGLELTDLQRIQSALGVQGRFRKLETLATALAQANLTAAKFHSIINVLSLNSTNHSMNGST